MTENMLRKNAELSGHSGPIYTVTSFYPGKVLTGSADKFVAAWDPEKRLPDAFSVKSEAAVYCTLYVEEKALLLVGQSTGGLHLIDLRSKTELKHLKWHEKGVFDVLYHKKRNAIYSLGGDGTFAVTHAETFELIRHIPLTDKKLRQVILSPDGHTLAIACGDGNIRFLDDDLYNEVYTIEAHKNSVYAMAFHPLKPILISGGADAMLRVWNGEKNYEKMLEIPAHNFSIYSIVFDPSGQFFATASKDKTIKIWNAQTLDMLQRIDIKSGGHRNSVNKLLWSENHGLFSVGDDGKLMIWETVSPSTPDAGPEKSHSKHE